MHQCHACGTSRAAGAAVDATGRDYDGILRRLDSILQCQRAGKEGLVDRFNRMDPPEGNCRLDTISSQIIRKGAGKIDLDSDGAAAATAAAVSNLSEIMRTMLRHPDLFVREIDIGIQLLTQGALSNRDRELAILRIGWLCQAPYEWGEHVLVAKHVGVTSEDIERITRGSAAPGWSEHDQAILRAAEELFADAMISDATWATLSKRLDDRQLIELPTVIGQYQAVAYYQNSLRLRLHNGNLGLKAR
jgi:alkylhydroperoxidase family enzyme